MSTQSTQLTQPTQLTQKELKEILSYDPDTGLFRWKMDSPYHKKGDIAGTRSEKKGFYRIYIKGWLYCSPRLAFLYMNGKMPKKNTHLQRKKSIKYSDFSTKDEYIPKQEDSVNKGIYRKKDKWSVKLPYSKKTKKKEVYIGLYSDKHYAIMIKYAAEILHGISGSKTYKYALDYFFEEGYSQEQIKLYTDNLIKEVKSVKKIAKRGVCCKQLDMSFESIRKASFFVGSNSSNIISCCKGRLKSAGKHPETGEKLTWEYQENDQ